MSYRCFRVVPGMLIEAGGGPVRKLVSGAGAFGAGAVSLGKNFSGNHGEQAPFVVDAPPSSNMSSAEEADFSSRNVPGNMEQGGPGGFRAPEVRVRGGWEDRIRDHQLLRLREVEQERAEALGSGAGITTERER